MKILILCLVLLFVAGCAHGPFSDWTRVDFTWQAAGTVLTMADWSQTREIASNPDYYEKWNPILGEHPSTGAVNTYFAACIAGSWILSDLLPGKWRRRWQWLHIGGSGVCVVHNIQNGVEFR